MAGMTQKGTSNTVLLVIGVVVALIVVVAVVFALQPPTQFDPSTPEGTAQGYFEAINDVDEDLARTFMTNELRLACDGEWWFYERGSANRVVITDTEIDGDTARIKVNIAVSYGEGPFNGGSYDQDETLVMVSEGDLWLISKPTWPMDPYACGERSGP
jgi:hypothetical protein